MPCERHFIDIGIHVKETNGAHTIKVKSFPPAWMQVQPVAHCCITLSLFWKKKLSHHLFNTFNLTCASHPCSLFSVLVETPLWCEHLQRMSCQFNEDVFWACLEFDWCMCFMELQCADFLRATFSAASCNFWLSQSNLWFLASATTARYSVYLPNRDHEVQISRENTWGHRWLHSCTWSAFNTPCAFSCSSWWIINYAWVIQQQWQQKHLSVNVVCSVKDV